MLRSFVQSCLEHICTADSNVKMKRKTREQRTAIHLQINMSASEAATAASGSSSASSGWTLWVGKPVKTRDSTGAVKYDHGQVEVRSGIATVKQLAAVLGAVQSPTELIEKRKLEGGEDPYSLFLFRDGLIPRWEEPSVKKGGRWMVTYKREVRGDCFRTNACILCPFIVLPLTMYRRTSALLLPSHLELAGQESFKLRHSQASP